METAVASRAEALSIGMPRIRMDAAESAAMSRMSLVSFVKSCW